MRVIAPHPAPAVRPLLALFIPTFNRPENLFATVRSIAPQLSAAVELHIIDNCSDQPVAEVLAADLELMGNPWITVHRNLVNIGGNANICRCLEYSHAEWTWMIGDDDPIVVDGVATVLEALAQAPADALFIAFDCKDVGSRSRICQTLESFLEDSAQGIGNINFITAGVYRTGVLRNDLCEAYQWLATCAPPLVLLMTYWHGHPGSVVYHPRDLRQRTRHVEDGRQAQIFSFCMAILPNIPRPWSRSLALRRLVADRLLVPMSLIYESFLEVRRGRQNIFQGIGYYHTVAFLKYSGLRWWLEETRFGYHLVRFIAIRMLRFLNLLPRRVSADEAPLPERR